VKIPQVGRVIIGDFCEIGANTCIDRSTLEETELKPYVKLDNLVQIGHNVIVGKGTAISAQTGISGSTRIGENVVIGGQVGVADHVRIADGVMIAAKSGVTGSIKTKMVVAGIPHIDIARWRRNWVIFRNMDQWRDRIQALEQIVRDLEAK
jgi:UDP-3-O-[3-hydroxymyristoyl] glucosamine N-acyltransferase